MTDPDTRPTMHWSVTRTAWFSLWILVALGVLYLLSGIYSVDSSEVGVVLRFGRVADAAVPPGIHYALPWPVDRVPVRNVMRMSVDDFHESSEVALGFRSLTGLSSYLITGDNNVVTVSCVLQYSIEDPAKYLFAVSDSAVALRSLACTTLVHCLSGMSISDILTTGKSGIQFYVKRELQRRLDELDSGLSISSVELQEVRPPQRVQEAFDDVINARIDKDKMINHAISYRNERIPEAKAAADRLIREAEAYRDRVMARAEGDSARFLDQHESYVANRELTRRRLHFEVMREVLGKLRHTMIVGQDGEQPLVRVITPKDR